MTVRRLVVVALALLCTCALIVAGCGSKEADSTNSTRGVSTTSAPATSVEKGGTLAEYKDAIYAWGDDLASNSPPELGEDAQGNPDFDDAEYRQHVEAEFEDLSQLKQMRPPQELAAKHQQLVDAFERYCQLDSQFQQAEARKDSEAATTAFGEADAQLYKVEDALYLILDAIDAAE